MGKTTGSIESRIHTNRAIGKPVQGANFANLMRCSKFYDPGTPPPVPTVRQSYTATMHEKNSR